MCTLAGKLQNRSSSRRSELMQDEGGKAVARVRERNEFHLQGSMGGSQEAVEAFQ